jgi:DNA topoisomerase-3
MSRPRQFVCDAREAGGAARRGREAELRLRSPARIVCKREITREEAGHCRDSGGLLTEFTSRFGRPFSATLVLKENGRHGFEFQPREPRAGRREPASAPSGTRRAASGRGAAGKAAAKPRRARAGGPGKAPARSEPAYSVGAREGAHPPRREIPAPPTRIFADLESPRR